MALDKLVDSTQLDNNLTSVANAIRAKSGGTGQLAFPAGFVSEIGNIPTGGGGITPSGTKEITITENGTITEDVTNYASVAITTNVPSGGGEKSIEHIFSYTPSSTASSVAIDVGNYKRPNRYALFVTSDNTENDGKYETIVKGYTIVVSKDGIVETGKTKGRIATLKVGSGTDFWNTSVFSTSQSGSTITVGGAGKYYKAGSEYTFFFYDLSDLL